MWQNYEKVLAKDGLKGRNREIVIFAFKANTHDMIDIVKWVENKQIKMTGEDQNP